MIEAATHPFDSLVEIYSKNPYAEISLNRAKRVVEFIKSIDFKPQDVLDIACGGGVGTKVFIEAGYNVRAIDISYKSLVRAMNESKDNFSYIQQDMRFLGFKNGCFDLITNIFDSLNYVTERDLDDMFSRSFQCLRGGGLIILDFLTPVAFSDIMIRPDSIYVGDGFYFLSTASPEFPDKTKLLLTAFIENGGNNSYRKIEETHMLQPFSVEKITSALIRNGFTVLMEFDGEDDKPAIRDSWHSFVVAKR